MTTQEGREWANSLFGCFGDSKLCLLTFCVPCYTIGKNAEGLGEDCLMHGLLAAVGCNFGPILRWRIRQEKGIKGSMMMDALTWGVLPCCALVQEARELGMGVPDKLDGLEQNGQDMNRT